MTRIPTQATGLPMTDEALAALAEAATRGPWQVSGVRFKWRDAGSDKLLDGHTIGPDSDAIALVFYGREDQHAEQWANARFIAAARDAVPDLLARVAKAGERASALTAEVERLRAERDAAGSVVAWARNHLFWIGQERTYTESEAKLADAIRKLEDGDD